MPEHCSRCGSKNSVVDMVDVVITERDGEPKPARWCRPCAKECRDKPWFAYGKDVDIEKLKAELVAKMSSQSGGSVAETHAGGPSVDRAVQVPPPAPSSPAPLGTKPKPKGKSGWEGMKKALPNLEAASKKLTEAREKGMSAGYIRLLERLVEQYKGGSQ